jgi:diketogulonate reductase-like aldo/keto reductase
MSSAAYVTLATGAKMPKIGLGTWQQSNVSAATAGSDAQDVYHAVTKALEIGYRHIDTAWAYFNEKEVGRAINDAIKAGKVKREEIFLTTKLFARFHHKDQVVKALKDQLADLGLDYVDMYLIHMPIAMKVDPESPKSIFPIKDGKLMADNVDHLETWAGMEEAFNLGLTKGIGVSNFNSRQIKRIYDNSKVKPHCLQVECHAYHPQYELHNFCKGLNIAFTAYAPIGSPGAGQLIKQMGGGDFPILMKEPCVLKAAENHKKSPAQILIRWLYERDIIVIPKSTNPERIKQNFQITDFTLTPEETKEIGSLKRGKLLGGGPMGTVKDHPEYPFADPF